MENPTQRGAVLVIDTSRGWPQELLDEIARLGFLLVRVDDARLIPFFVLAGGVTAVLLDARSLGMMELLALRKCREHAPCTSVVVASPEATQEEYKRALDGGATAFLSLPASPLLLGEALRSGSARTEATA